MCNPWSTRLHPYPSLIRKMKTYLELEGKVGPKPRPQPQTQSQPCISTPSQNNNSLTRKTPRPKMANRRRTRAPAKRRYKVMVIAKPLPTTPTMTMPLNSIPAPTVATSTASSQTPMMKFTATSIPVTVYNLAQGKFEGIPYPTRRPKVEENPSTPNCSPPQPEAIPNTLTFQVREDAPWPNTIPASTNLFPARTDWSIPPTQTPAVKVEKTEVPPGVAAIPHAMVLPKPQNNKQAEEKCTWGPYCPICKKEEEEGTENWNSDRQENQQRNHHPQNPQYPKPMMFLIGIQRRSGYTENGMRGWSVCMKNTILTTTPAWSLIPTLSWNSSMKHSYKYFIVFPTKIEKIGF